MKIAALSVFFPAYNEEKNIKKTVNASVEKLKKTAGSYEVIVVDDGSLDQTAVIVKKLIKRNPRIKLIAHTPNRGYGAALKSGFTHCQYPWIAYTDSDGQFNFQEIDNFLDRRDEADLIIGYRSPRRDPWQRILIGQMLKFWNLIFFGLWMHDVDCGFKLIKKEVIDQIGTLQTSSGMTATELLVKAKKSGFKIIEIPVTHYPRQAGRQTGADPQVIWRSIKESFRLWQSLSNS